LQGKTPKRPPENPATTCRAFYKALLLAWVLGCLGLAFLTAGGPVIKFIPGAPGAFLQASSQKARLFFTDHLTALPQTKRPYK
jgi:hypothetical protein